MQTELGKGEEKIHSIAFHPYLMWRYASAIALLLFMPFAWWKSVLIIMVFVLTPLAWLNFISRHCILTNRRLIWEEGILMRGSRDFPLNKINEVTVNVPLIGRLLDFGTIKVDTANVGAPIIIRYVKNPFQFKDAVLSEMDKHGSAKSR